MAELKLVRTLDQAKDDVIRDLRTNWKSIRDLSRKHSLSESIILDLQKVHDPHKKRKNLVKTPRAPKAPDPPPPSSQLSSPVESRIIERANTFSIVLIAWALATIGIVLNYQSTSALGQTPATSFGLGIVGAIIDCLAVLLPSRAEMLWMDGRKFSAVFVAGFGGLFILLSLYSGMNFSASNIGDTLQGREIKIQHRQALNSELAVIKAERSKITEDRDPEALKDLIQIARGQIPLVSLKSSNDCTDVTTSGKFCSDLNQLRAAKRTAERRIELDGRLHSLNEQIASLPPIATRNPAAESFSQAIGGIVDADRIEKFWIRGIAFLPSLAGLLLMFARGR